MAKSVQRKHTILLSRGSVSREALIMISMMYVTIRNDNDDDNNSIMLMVYIILMKTIIMMITITIA